MSADDSSKSQWSVASKTWRFKAGVAAMALAVLLPILALLIPLFGLPVAQSASLATALVAGTPEVLCLLAVALLGKENFNLLRSSAKSALLAAFLRPASKSRYYFALVLNLLTWLPLLLYAYLPAWMPKERIVILAGSDLIFILTLFFLGGQFWGKFQRIFIWEDVSWLRFRSSSSVPFQFWIDVNEIHRSRRARRRLTSERGRLKSHAKRGHAKN